MKKSKKSKLIIVILFFLGALVGICYIYYNYKCVESRVSKQDEESPIIIASNITITEGDSVDLLKDVSVSDNVDKDLKIEVFGDYDINKPGSYTITYEATDKSNNTGKKDIILTVNKKIINTPLEYEKGHHDFVTSKGFSGYSEDGVTFIDGILIANKTYSLPKDYGNGLVVAAKEAFDEMKAAALVDGISLWICSGFRSYNTQSNLYNNYVNRDGKEAADTYSARPGYSEHQTGLAMDINYASSSFNGSEEAIWLNDNAYKFGFILRYPDGKTNETGYKYESWHYRYVGVDLATKLYNDGKWITLEDYFGITSEYID